MSNITLCTDSTCDRPLSWLQERGIACIPLTYVMNDEEYVDEYSFEENAVFYARLKNGETSKTSAISTQSFIELFEEEVQKGNQVVYTGLASKISATFNNASLAAQYINEKYDDKKIFVVDSRSTSLILSYLLEEMKKMIDAGKSPEKIVEFVEKNYANYSAWFSVDDLQHLKRGGRISGAAATVGSILNIKPILILTDKGAIEIKEKVKGTKKVFKTFMNELIKNKKTLKGIIYIIHTNALGTASDLKAQINAEFPKCEVEIHELGRVVGTHVGPGAIVLMANVGQRNYQ